MHIPSDSNVQLADKDCYQTVYAKEQGSAAAPTAGLHFTEELLAEIKGMGVNIAYITLHVGLGTFRPVSVDTIEDHTMHSEFYHMSKATAEVLTKTKQNNGRIRSEERRV